MSIIQSIILGIMQGAGEFLPISSTAHLIIIPYLFHWPDPGLSFDVALHLGTLIALVAFFWKDWMEILFNFQYSVFNTLGIKSNKIPSARYYIQNSSLLWLIIIATIPGVIFGLLLESKAEAAFRNPLLIAFTLGFVGLILFLADKYLTHKRTIKELNWKDSLLIGISQAIAIIPGVSRSGATITTGLWRGLSRVDAARFSFLLSMPIIFGAAVLKLPRLFSHGLSLELFLGILFSAISGYLAIKYLLKFVERSSYRVFFWYRLGLALLIVIVYSLR
jgi:undecaprenyl-diphosphatase